MGGRNTSFYYSFVALPPEKRAAITAVWDFCRAVDDTVDEGVPCVRGGAGSDAADRARRGIEAWRRDLDCCFTGKTPGSAQARHLQPYVSRFNLPRAALEAVIDGVEMDLGRCRYQDFAALREYCVRVASAVGLVCIEIFGYRDPAARDYAVDLGIALQLTNIIRDVRVDLSRDRVYLPLEDLEKFGCSEADLAAGLACDRVPRLLQFECDRARGYYASAERKLPAGDRRSLVAARIMAAIDRDVLRRIERSGYDVFSGTVRASRAGRAAIAAATWARTVAGW